MAQSLPQLLPVATSTPQLIQVRRGQSAHQLRHQLLATGAPSPHHQMAQNLPHLFTIATSTTQLILVRVGQQIQAPPALASGPPSPHHQMAQNLPQLFTMATSTKVSD